VLSTHRGYTLLEVTLVMVLIVILVSLAYPSIENYYTSVRTRAGADAVRTAWVQARAHAMDEGQSYRFSVLPGQSSYRIAPDNASYWGRGDPPTVDDPELRPLVLAEDLPKGVRFIMNGQGEDAQQDNDKETPAKDVDPGQFQTVVIFKPDGTTNVDVEIVLRMGTAAGIKTNLRSLTGTSSVEDVGPSQRAR
jgi:prepilin-type N-terminal cleavage/methylation domain-containing protein